MDQLLEHCLLQDASDLHFEPFEHHAVIRYRVDGFLKTYEKIPISQHTLILSRMKVLADLKIGERRLPQDGAISINDRTPAIDLRISTLPTVYGEKMAIRILKKEPKYKDIDELGMHPLVKVQFQKSLKQTTGLILLTGPTSSGKTTTLYTALQFLNQTHRNITTLEDPVEYKIDGINQVQVNSQIGLNFGKGLRAILRQDPNVIMIGEIRDHETANIAIQSALTGHLILSSLHTYDTASAITRLLDMGIEPYLIASSIRLILAQRLVRKRCSCNGQNPECLICGGDGYQGRFAVFEMLPIDDSIHDLILQRASVHQIRDKMKEMNLKRLQDEVLEQVQLGKTTMEEFHRVMVTDYE
ncbi:GspE/PulE family protein [Tepidibacillus sp. HK-1]|uniref:GspE/PulE family protein n=1 Tax=Tepidibacillus sp. HK-1 TaxID=1883407 RepID=UPI002104E655|nr:GspE/PulE family protein [Tepidibacillus sp. HK-1]